MKSYKVVSSFDGRQRTESQEVRNLSVAKCLLSASIAHYERLGYRGCLSELGQVELLDKAGLCAGTLRILQREEQQ